VYPEQDLSRPISVLSCRKAGQPLVSAACVAHKRPTVAVISAEVERSDLLSGQEKKAVFYFNPSRRDSAGHLRDLKSCRKSFSTVATPAGCPSSQDLSLAPVRVRACFCELATNRICTCWASYNGGRLYLAENVSSLDRGNRRHRHRNACLDAAS
jgi:hypothetical protein